MAGQGLVPDQQAATPARVYDYLLGGKTNLEPDRRAARKLIRAKPTIVENARANRRFLGRVVKYLAGEAGVTQFLDIGCGLPNLDNTHEVAQRTTPAARVVYIDNDPTVVASAQGMLTSTPQGTVTFFLADLHDPAGLLRQASDPLDFAQPVAVLVLGVLMLFEDRDDPWAAIRDVMAATGRGSHLAICHPARDLLPDQAQAGARIYDREVHRQTNRTQGEVTRFFDGLMLLPPGIVPANRWRPGPGEDTSIQLSNWVGLARKS